MVIFRKILEFLTGRGGALAVDLVEAVRPNAEAEARRIQERAVLASAPAGGAAVEALRALVRPSFAFAVLALFAWPAFDAVGFTAYMVALTAMPENLWIMSGGVVAFYFGFRTVEKRAAQGAVIAAARASIDGAAEIRARAVPEDPPPSAPPVASPAVSDEGLGVRQAGGAVRPADLSSRNNPALDRVKVALAAGG